MNCSVSLLRYLDDARTIENELGILAGRKKKGMMHFGCLKHVFWCVILNFVMLDRSRGVITERIFEIFIPELEGDGHSTTSRSGGMLSIADLEYELDPPFDCFTQISFQIVSISPTVTNQSDPTTSQSVPVVSAARIKNAPCLKIRTDSLFEVQI